MGHNDIYNKDYYNNDFGGVDYHDKKSWDDLFKRFARKILEDLNPKTVLDVGCAFGYMVEYLRDLGIEAWGIDISEYAISQAREDIKPYLRVASATEPLPDDIPQFYDLVLNIEVLEHLYEEDGMKALESICAYGDKIFFSSSGSDITEATHLNVQQMEYWAEKFAKKGFYKNLLYSTEYLSKYSALFEKIEIDKPRAVRIYEHSLRLLNYKLENEQRTSAKLVNDIKIVCNEKEKDEDYFRNEISRLTEEIKIKIEENIGIKEQIFKLESQSILLTNSLEKSKNEIAILREENEDIKKDNEDIKKDNEDIKKDNEDIKKDNLLYEKKLIDLDNDLKKNLEKIKIFEEKINVLNGEKDTLQNIYNNIFYENEQSKNRLNSILCSRGYKVVLKYYVVRDKILPFGSLRRKMVKYLVKTPNKIFHSDNITNTLEVANKNISNEISHSFYSDDEKEHQNWCRDHKLNVDIKFSIVVPVFNTPQPILEAMIFSVKDQIYDNWELCIVDASPEKEEIRYCIEQLSKDCNKIKYKKLKKNGGISDNTIEGMDMATGDFVALLDHDDIIAPNALYEYALWLQKEPDIDFFYSDKDMINEEGTARINPLFKPEYSQEIMYSANYFTHFCAIRRSIVDKTLGFDKDTDGAQDWDIFLKVMELTDKIKRIDRVLYHWRIISTSVASGIQAKPYVLDAQLKALNGYVMRKNWSGKIYFKDRDKSSIKVDWTFKKNPSATIVMISENGKKQISVGNKNVTLICISKKDVSGINEAVKEISTDVIIFIDTDQCIDFSNNLIDELSAWALHPEIAFVAPQLRSNELIKSCGLVYEDNNVMDMFGDKPIGFYGEMGGSEWYRNFSIFRSTCIAIEKDKFIINKCMFKPEFGEFSITHNCFSMINSNYRNVYDHFAWAEVNNRFSNNETINKDFKLLKQNINILMNDPYFNKNCTIDVSRLKKTEINSLAATHIDKYTQDAIALAGMFDFSQKDLEKNNNIVENSYDGEIKTMVWFLQEFDYVFFAGLYTIFRTADYLRKEHGIKHTFAFLANINPQEMLNRVGEGFPELAECDAIKVVSYDDLSKLHNFDASVCTLWTTAYYSLKFNKVKRKFYFIQDFEPLFYPGGSTYAQTEATYRFGFYGIANTQGLKNMYENEYNNKAVSLNPSVDTSIFYPSENKIYNKKQYLVFFYGRPGHPRNGFELGIQALKKLKELMGNKVKIVTAGADYDIKAYGLEGIIENLGRLKIEETGELYRNCDAGLVMMYTRHPSYLPYEMMACGCCVVSNYNSYTTWFLKNGQNSIVCEPSASSIAESIKDILNDSVKRKTISENGANQLLTDNPEWGESLERVAKFIQNPGQE